MSYYNMDWPYWWPEEDVLLIWLACLGIEIPDIARVMTHRLRRPTRTRPAIMRRMEWINQKQRDRGRPIICEDGMADWDKVAAQNYLICLTNDTNLLRDLLQFSNQDLFLLEAVCYTPSYSQSSARSSLTTPWLQYSGIPLNEVVDVNLMQSELDGFLSKHWARWHHPSPRGGRSFF